MIATVSRWIERLLWLAALFGIAVALGGYGEGWIWQFYWNRQFNRVLQPNTARGTHDELSEFSALPDETPKVNVKADTSAPVPYMGRLDIPKLEISVMILEGDDKSALLRGVGHIPATARPGERGNIGLAGHRDTFFRHLGRIETHDRMILRTTTGTYEYEVRSVLIVSPNTREVLENSSQEMLTLVTCYPFDFLGPAPERFIVQAFRTK